MDQQVQCIQSLWSEQRLGEGGGTEIDVIDLMARNSDRWLPVMCPLASLTYMDIMLQVNWHCIFCSMDGKALLLQGIKIQKVG